MDTTNIRCAGKLRGGCSWYARSSIQFYSENSHDEGLALTGALIESLGWTNKWVQSGDAMHSTFEYAFDTRREFALLPMMIREFTKRGYVTRLVNYDRPHHDSVVSLDTDPATFWREIALAQMFFGVEPE